MTISARDFHNISNEALGALVEKGALSCYLRYAAISFYDGNFQPKPEITANLKYGHVSERLADYMEPNESVRVGEWLASQNVIECAKYKGGGSGDALAARTLAGKACVIRIPTRFHEADAHQRIVHAAGLQPLRSVGSENAPAVLEYRGDQIEILPFVPVVGITSKDSPLEKLQYILMAMYGLVGLDCSRGVKTDLGVLPDGTPLPVDPDILKFFSQPQSLKESEHRLNDILDTTQYATMKPMAWIKDGKPAQDIFFPPDYLSTPLTPKPNSELGSLVPWVQ